MARAGVWRWCALLSVVLGASCASDAPGIAPVTQDSGVAGETVAPFVYVALGDSYAAGAGLAEELDGEGSFDDDVRCERHDDAYPARVAGELVTEREVDFRFAACSGARIEDVRGQMKGSATALREADLVTVTAGGNDLEWPDVLRRCATTWQLSQGQLSCTHGEEELLARIDDVLVELGVLCDDLVQIAPRARILVVGYPHIAPSPPVSTCLPFVPTNIDGDEQAMIRRLGEHLRDGLADLARETGVELVDLIPVYTGHEPCTDDEWIHALRRDFGSSQSFHPKVVGHHATAVHVLAEVP